MLDFFSLPVLVAALPQADDPTFYDASPGPHVGFTISGTQTG